MHGDVFHCLNSFVIGIRRIFRIILKMKTFPKQIEKKSEKKSNKKSRIKKSKCRKISPNIGYYMRLRIVEGK